MVVVRSHAPHGLKQDVLAGTHHLVADEPGGIGGTDEGPSPYEFLLAALGTCTAITLELYARRKRWPLARVTVRLRHARLHARDCADCPSSEEARLERIEREVALEGPLDEAQRARLIAIAERCPVHRSLEQGIAIVTREVTEPGADRRAA